MSLRLSLAKTLNFYTGAPVDQLELILTMIMVYPISLFNHLIHGRTPRLIYSLLSGALLQFSIYNWGIVHMAITSVFVYLFVKFLGRRVSAFYVLIATIAYMCILNAYNIIYHYGEWSVSPATAYMVSIAKFSSIAFSYEDGGNSDEIVKNKHLIEYRLKEPPSFLGLLSFVFFYGTALIGPSFEYKDFIDFIDEKNDYSNLFSDANKRKVLINSSLFYFGCSLIAMMGYVILGSKVNFTDIYKDDFAFKHSNFLVKLVFLFIAGLLSRAKYYSGWLLNHGSLCLSGIAYCEESEKGKVVRKVEKVKYGSIRNVELSIKLSDRMGHWNSQIHFWLKYSLYIRLLRLEIRPFKGNKALGKLITYVVSALWHGFYVTYYITFIFTYLMQESLGYFESLGLTSFIERHSFIYPLALFFLQSLFNGIWALFDGLSFKDMLLFLRNYDFFPVVAVVVCYGAFILGKVFGIRAKEKTG